jgi:hypothetical protein
MGGIVNRAFRGFSLEPAFSEGKHALAAKNYIFITSCAARPGGSTRPLLRGQRLACASMRARRHTAADEAPLPRCKNMLPQSLHGVDKCKSRHTLCGGKASAFPVGAPVFSAPYAET